MKRTLKVQLADNGMIVKDKDADTLTVIEYESTDSAKFPPELNPKTQRELGAILLKDIWATLVEIPTESCEVVINIKG